MFKIKELIAKNVHGYIPINLKFNDDLTFLTGSNGCGKTTALKLISAILQPDLDLLTKIKYTSITLKCSLENKTWSIKLSKTNGKSEIAWEVKQFRVKDIQSGTFRTFPYRHEYGFSAEERESLRETILSDFITSDFHAIIESFGNPILLGIDRKIFGKTYDFRKDFRYRQISRNHIPSRQNESFHYAQKVLIDYVSSNADKKKELVEELKSNIFRTLFKYVSHSEMEQGFNLLSPTALKKKKDSTLDAVKKLEIGNEIVTEVELYFNSIEKLQSILDEESKDDDERQRYLKEWWANRPHMKRIEQISNHSNKYQKKIEELDYPLNEITKISNHFFEEGNKYLSIGATGALRVVWKKKELSTYNLSSGEIQLLVIIIHLVFCEHENEQSVFVIDEPELSLHLSWQEKFVDAITKASPGTQFILATHSPAIISKLEFESKCIYMKNV